MLFQTSFRKGIGLLAANDENKLQKPFNPKFHYEGYRLLDMFIGPGMLDGKPDFGSTVSYARLDYRHSREGKTCVEFGAENAYQTISGQVETKIHRPAVVSYLNKPIKSLRLGDVVPIGAEDYSVIYANIGEQEGEIKLAKEKARVHMGGGDILEAGKLQIKLAKVNPDKSAEFEILDENGKFLEEIRQYEGELVRRSDGTPLFYFGNSECDEFCLRYNQLDIIFSDKTYTLRSDSNIAESKKGDGNYDWTVYLGSKNSAHNQYDPNGNSICLVNFKEMENLRHQIGGSRWQVPEIAGRGDIVNKGLVNDQKVNADLRLVGPMEFRVDGNLYRPYVANLEVGNEARMLVQVGVGGVRLEEASEVYVDLLNNGMEPMIFFENAQTGKMEIGEYVAITNGRAGGGLNCWRLGGHMFNNKYMVCLASNLRNNAGPERGQIEGLEIFPNREFGDNDPNFSYDNGMPTIASHSSLFPIPPERITNYAKKLINERGDEFNIEHTGIKMFLSADVTKIRYEVELSENPKDELKEKYRLVHRGVRLLENYPNPMQVHTYIKFSNPYPSANITIKVYDMTGKEVAVVANNETHGTGLHDIAFVKPELPPGIYAVKMWAFVPSIQPDGATITDRKTIVKK